MRFPSSSQAAALLLCSAALGACKGGGPTTYSDTTAMWAVPTSLAELSEGTFFDHPWPSDLRLENGAPRFTGFPNPKSMPLVAQYIETANGLLDGFSPAGGGYLRFTGAIDPASLPADPAAALDPSASVQLLDVDPSSPERGQRKLVSLRWQEAAAVYYPANTLAFMPTIGFPLRPRTRYALVVTDSLKAPSGGAVAQAADLAKVLGESAADDRTKAAADALAPAVAEIDAAGIDPARIVHLAVFTTDDPTQELAAIRDAMPSLVPAPVAQQSQWHVEQQKADFDEYVGKYGPTPNFQHGTMPYQSAGDGGGFELDAGGTPVLDSTFYLRFSLTVPKAAACPMPAEGYPIVLYAHGTGGDYRSYVYDGTAESLAQRCLASMGIDQIFHGTRPGAPSDSTEIALLFFNFQNPIAARTNGRQAAVDEIQRARLFTESKVTVPASVSTTQKQIRFDGSRLMFFGHSQGGLNGPLYTAIDDSARGAVFSGSGAQISIALLEKTLPAPSVAGLVKSLMLGLASDEGGELDAFHPAMTLAQSLIDPVDPLHYGRLQLAEPRAGFAPKSVYMTEGINPDGVGDSYAPPHGIEAHALAIGLPLQLPGQFPIPQAAWAGIDGVTVGPEGLAGNLADGKASGVLAQWPVPAGDDGHFVVFDVPAARKQAAEFLKNLAASPTGKVPAP